MCLYCVDIGIIVVETGYTNYKNRFQSSCASRAQIFSLEALLNVAEIKDKNPAHKIWQAIFKPKTSLRNAVE